MNTKHEIEIPGYTIDIPGLPRGWRAVAYRIGKKEEWVFRSGGMNGY